MRVLPASRSLPHNYITVVKGTFAPQLGSWEIAGRFVGIHSTCAKGINFAASRVKLYGLLKGSKGATAPALNSGDKNN